MWWNKTSSYIHPSFIPSHDEKRNCEVGKRFAYLQQQQQQRRPQQGLERGGGGRRNGPSAAALRKPLQNHPHATPKTAGLGFLHIPSSELRIAIHSITSISQTLNPATALCVGRAGGRWWMPPLLWSFVGLAIVLSCFCCLFICIGI